MLSAPANGNAVNVGLKMRSSSAMTPNSSSKLSERLKAYLSTNGVKVEDPYAFCEEDVKEPSLKSRRHSIITGGKTAPPATTARRKTPKVESSDEDEDVGLGLVYQKHWFSRELEAQATSREARLEMTRAELGRRLQQMRRAGSDGDDRYDPVRAARKALKRVSRPRIPKTVAGDPRAGPLAARACTTCGRPALPCTAHCTLHIMDNADQTLFEFCTAKFADNTQCSVPVFDIAHELPLCTEHARKRDNYDRMCAETRPKKPRRKIKPSAMIRPQKRGKKRSRRPLVSAPSGEEELRPTVPIPVPVDDVVEQVLAMTDEDELVTVEQALVTQATRLLEETDFTNVLNQIPTDEFNDLFNDRNGEYEPSREETEELERALEAVDEDVKSLEKLSQTQGLLDSLLDENTLVDTLVQIPDLLHHNGYQQSAPVDVLPQTTHHIA